MLDFIGDGAKVSQQLELFCCRVFLYLQNFALGRVYAEPGDLLQVVEDLLELGVGHS